MADALKKVFADRKAQVSPGFPTVIWGLLHFEALRLGSSIEDANFSFDMILCWDTTGRTVSTLPAYHHIFLPARFHFHSILVKHGIMAFSC